MPCFEDLGPDFWDRYQMVIFKFLNSDDEHEKSTLAVSDYGSCYGFL